MPSRLVNVRLDAERLSKARQLRERGISLSDVVREAIDERYAADCCVTPPTDAKALIADLFNRHPDPPGLSPRTYDVHDRDAARGAIRRALTRRRP